jgi:DNA-binding MurR/RpiR family transcriptional regulator
MTSSNPGMSLHALIRSRYEDMRPTERRLADLLLNFPGELAGYSASELAHMAGTSNSAVSRLVRRLGFQNYEDLRRRARAERDLGAPLYLLDKSFEEGGEAQGPAVAAPEAGRRSAELVARHVDTAIDNIRASFPPSEAQRLDEIGAALAEARHVWIAGFRHSYYLAGYLRWSLAHVRPDVRLLPNTGETLGENLADLSSADVVLVVAFRRRTPFVGGILNCARECGARIALVTDPGMIADSGADWVVRCQSRTRGPIDDHASAIVLAHILTEQVIARLGRAARSRFARIDDLHREMSELVT